MNWRRQAGSLLFLMALLLLGAQQAAAVSDIEVSSVAVPSTVRAGQSIDINVTVDNPGTVNHVNSLDITVQAWGQTTTLEDQTLQRGQKRTFTVNMTVPSDASGPETLDVTAATSGDRDVAAVSVTVRELTVTLTLTPAEASAGQHVAVVGRTSTPDIPVELYVDGRYHATLQSDRTGRYQTTITPERVGATRVRAVAGGASADRILRVYPELAVQEVTAPATVNTGERFQVCADLYYAGSDAISLRITADDTPIHNASLFFTSTTEHYCAHVQVKDPGETSVRVLVQADSLSDARGKTVAVVEPGVSAQVDPANLELVRGTAGLIEVELVNDATATRTFTVEPTGFTNLSTLTTQQTTLRQGQTETVYLRVVPPDVGTYTGRIVVTANDATYADRTITVTATENPALSGRIMAAAQDHVDTASRFARTQPYEVIAGVAVVVLFIVVLLFRHTHHTVLEPRRRTQ